MKIVKFNDIPIVPISHEDPENPGAVKKVLLGPKKGIHGHIQMINWATLLPGKSFRSHFHKDMYEIHIMMTSGALANIDGKRVMLKKGDALVVEPHETHFMKNTTATPIEYIVIGVVGDK